jgi:DNA-directed RNA polymerase sigma subunit (sigma70/sigma32)
MDRVAEGNEALISACRTYQTRLNGSFRRYCQLKIRQAIEYALAEVASFPIVLWEGETHHSA